MAPPVSSQRRILIVEDNPADVRLMREALRDLTPPAALTIAADTEEAARILGCDAERASSEVPDLIFLDFNLPKSDSRDLLRRIKEHETLRVIPVAVLTTSEAERDIHDAYELYANCYLRKPADLDTFLDTVRSAAHFWLNIAYRPGNLRSSLNNRYLL